MTWTSSAPTLAMPRPKPVNDRRIKDLVWTLRTEADNAGARSRNGEIFIAAAALIRDMDAEWRHQSKRMDNLVRAIKDFEEAGA